MKEENNEKQSENFEEEVENLTEENVQNDELQDNSAETEEENAEVSEIAKLETELSESKDKYLRLYSEFENYRRRTAREKLDLINTAAEDLMTALIPVLDDFERAENSITAESDLKSYKDGVDLIYLKFKKTLEQKGLKDMNSKIGGPFDPDYQEAITQIPAPSNKLKGKIVDVIEKGYLLKDKVIRYAKVVTGS